MAKQQRCLILAAICTAGLGCADGNVPDSTGPQEALTGATAPALRPAPVLMSRPAPTFNVTSPLPVEFPTADEIPPFTKFVTIGPEKPANAAKLPLGPGIQPSPEAIAADAAGTCKAAPSLSLNCPAGAPTASTCTSREKFPAGCRSMVVPGANYPVGAFPACCS